MNTFGNWQNHDEAFRRSVERAQRVYDAKVPDDDSDCKESGHDWRRLPGRDNDGTQFARCRKCGLVEEV